MSVKHLLALTAATFIIQPVLATENTSNAKPCGAIVKSCLDAGYTQRDSDSKAFWNDCMKPLVLGKTVEGITVDAKDVKACRADKIDQLQQELRELKAVKS